MNAGAEPPRLTRALLALFTPRGIRGEAVLGDLEEEYRYRVERDGAYQARWWYRRQAWRVLGLYALPGRRPHDPERPLPPPSAARRSSVTDELFQDFRFALRTLRRAPAFAALVILNLGVAWGMLAGVFSVVDGVMLKPLPFPRPERLAYVLSPALRVAGPNDLDPAPEAMEPLALFTIDVGILAGVKSPRRIAFMPVGRGFFDLLGVLPAEGRQLGETDHRPGAPPAALVSHRLWQQQLGGGTVVGRTLTLDGRIFEVAGVLPQGFAIMRYQETDIWIPWETAAVPRGGMALTRLRPDVSPEAAEERLGVWVERLANEETAEQIERFGMQPVTVSDLKEGTVGGLGDTLWLLLAGSALLLVVAGANLAILLLGRTTARQSELSVRAALGAGRGRLARQLVVEVGVLALGGGVLALAMAGPATRVLLGLAPDYLPRLDEVTLSLRVLLTTAAASGLTVVLFGVLPALAVAGRIRGSVRGHWRSGAGRREGVIQSTLVVAEVAAGLFLVVAAGLLTQTFLALNPTRPGFRLEGILTAQVFMPEETYVTPEDRVAAVDRVLESVSALPSRPGAAAMSYLPISGVVWSALVGAVDQRAGDPEERPARLYFQAITSDFLKLMEVPLLEGRDARERSHELVINQAAAARLWPGRSPLGHTIRLDLSDQDFTVVGVVRDTWAGRRPDPRPQAFAPFLALSGGVDNEFQIVVESTADRPVTESDLRQAVADADPTLAVEGVAPLGEAISAAALYNRFVASLLLIPAGVTLLLAAAGCFGALTQLVSGRTREMGIRLALGSSPQALLGLVLGRSAALALAGVGVGLAGAWVGTRFLESSLYGVEPMDPATLTGASAILVLTALAAAASPALRAARIDPVKTLGVEG